MPYIRIQDLNMFYEDMGDGEPVLFLHSHFSRGLLAFASQIQPFQAKYRCLFPDFRGQGRTMCESLKWDSRQIADDMAAFMDALGIEQAHLFGYSCGATVGMYMAAKYPKKICSLTAVGAGAYPRPGGSEDFLPENLLAKGDIQFIQEMRIRHFEAHRGKWQTFLEQTVDDWRRHPSLTDAEWKSVSCPCFFINGEHDPFGTCAELKERLPHSKTCEVAGSGHRPHFVMEQGKEINTMVLNFLEELSK